MPSRQNLRRAITVTASVVAVLAVVWIVAVARAETAQPTEFFDRLGANTPVIASDVGRSEIWPENTLSAIRASSAIGVDVVAVDVRLTQDGVPVLVRDETVDRTTDGTGLVSEIALPDLLELDAAYSFQPQGTDGYPFRGLNIQVPTLEDVLREFDQLFLILFLREDDTRLLEEVQRLLREYDREATVIVQVDSDEAVAVFTERVPSLALGATPAEIRRFFILHLMFSSGAHTPESHVFITSPENASQYPSRRFIRDAAGQGLRTGVRTTGDGSGYQILFNRDVDLIISPIPDRAMSVLGRL